MTTTDIDVEAERELFEDYVRSVNPKALMLDRWPAGHYKNIGVDGHWRGWLAAKRSVPAQTGTIDDVAGADLPEQRPSGAVYGIIDPDYGRIYTMVRKLAWEEGYAIGLHGSFTRDLDMIAVPWDAGRRCNPTKLVARILQATGLKEAHGNPHEKPHGRLVWTLLLPEFGDPRFVDLSIMTVAAPEVSASPVPLASGNTNNDAEKK